MPVSRLASDLDIQGMDILTTDAAIHIRTTDTTVRTTTATMDRHFIGITVIAFTIRESTDTIGIGTKPKRGLSTFTAGGRKNPAGYFFGEVEAAGADVEVTEGDGS